MISIIVPTYNEEKHITTCLKALLAQTLPKKEFEIIVSDSSSTDKTVQVAKKLADKVVVCKKVSAGYGRNFGSKKAGGNILAFIDADTIASPTWLEGIKEEMSKKNCVAVTGPYNAFENDSLSERIYFKAWSFEVRAGMLAGFPLLAGFSFAVKKSIFEKAKGFREDDMTCEDYDLCLRIKKLGKIQFNNKISVKTSARRLRQMGLFRYTWHGIMFILFKKKYGWAIHRKDW